MIEFLGSSDQRREWRWKTRVALRTGLVVIMSVLAMATGASELVLITPPSNQLLKRALPLLSGYLTEKLDGVSTIRPVISGSYNKTGQRFESNQASLVYGGSFLAYILCARGLAIPLARGENKAGVSTYRSVLLTKKTTPFHGVESIMGRRITYVTEASSGDVFARQFFGGENPSSVADTVYVPARSHNIAVRLVQAGRADFAFVKNLDWEALKANYQGLHMVASGAGNHPDNVFLVNPSTYRTYGKQLETILLSMDSDPDRRAGEILDIMGLKRFIPTIYPDDFEDTAALVRDAGLDPVMYKFLE